MALTVAPAAPDALVVLLVGIAQADERHVVAVLWLVLVAIAFVVMIWRRHFFPEGPPLSRAAAFALSALVALAWFIGSLGLSASFATLLVISATFFPLHHFANVLMS